jgi:hypothetical protein
MEKSQSIKSIAGALLLFQNKVGAVKKDAVNPFFKSKYASLNTIIEHINLPLSECGLSYAQFPDESGLTTILMHSESGEYLQSTYLMPVAKQNDPQAVGSAITYARRYALGAILGLAIDEDDDANSATSATIQPNHNVNVAESKKEWLNKFDKDGSTLTEKWQKAKINLEAGKVTLEQIKAKYIVSKINQDELLTFVKK